MLSLDEQSAFVTTFITKPELRGQGIGMKVWDACKKAVAGKNILINAAPDREKMYNRLGFVVSKNRMAIVDYVFLFKKADTLREVQVDKSVVLDYCQSLFDGICAYDKGIQPIERAAFLKNHIEKSDKVKVTLRNGKVAGYVCLRKGYKGFMIMPLYANTTEIARQLLKEIVAGVSDNETLKIGIPNGNKEAEDLFKEVGWYSRPYNPMYVNLRMQTSTDYADNIDQSRVFSAMNYSYVLI